MSQSTTHGSWQSSGITAFVSLAISPDSAVPHSVTFSTITMLLHSFCNHNNYLYALVVVSKLLPSVYNHNFNPYYTHTACSLSHSVSPTSSNGGICSTYLALHPAHPSVSPPSFGLSEYFVWHCGVCFGSHPKQPVPAAWPSPQLLRYLPANAITDVRAWQTGVWLPARP